MLRAELREEEEDILGIFILVHIQKYLVASIHITLPKQTNPITLTELTRQLFKVCTVVVAPASAFGCMSG
jgi:hypothetical protein